jgi:hypothetical protein
VQHVGVPVRRVVKLEPAEQCAEPPLPPTSVAREYSCRPQAGASDSWNEDRRPLASRSVGFLAAQQRADDRPREDRLGVRFYAFPEDFPTRQIPDRRLVGGKHSLDGVVATKLSIRASQWTSCLCHRISPA